ncbi:MAG: tRNA (adenosine(37)-N6)-threonylcarbamoyltransferase complex dimerization subunit type 1 TsaB [Verrucomicrobia bacterium]|nr:tRNA (adenosine(37)-N6)-threonylcarbamoyltransferase complex dimerization subunit type 1 TsaB [Verrucomicrobiota bacterium]
MAVVLLDAKSAVHTVLAAVSEEDGQEVRPLPMIELALKNAGIEREAIECVAVGLGPGSYTGVRSAIALAQGWQLGRSVGLLGVSSADALAAGAQAKGWFGRVGVVIDAQRDEFYGAGYEVAEAGWRPKEPLRIASRDEIQNFASAYDAIVGPEATKFFPQARILCPRADTFGALARGRADFVPGEKLEPIYLREAKFVKAPPPRVMPGL